MKAIVWLALPLAGCMTLTPADARRVTYACENGTELKVVYSGQVANIENPDGPKAELMRLQRPTGVLYSSNSRKIRGEGDVISYELGKAEPVTCRAMAPAR